MSDLVVSASLDDTNRQLKTILHEFQNCGKDADRYHDIWGQSDLEDALSSFANNWYIHRQSIEKTLSKLSKDIDKACHTWSHAEKKLSDSIQVSKSQEGGGS